METGGVSWTRGVSGGVCGACGRCEPWVGVGNACVWECGRKVGSAATVGRAPRVPREERFLSCALKCGPFKGA